MKGLGCDLGPEAPDCETAEAMVRALGPLETRAADPYGRDKPSKVPRPTNQPDQGEPVPQPGKLPQGVPPYLKPIPFNTRDIQKVMDSHLAKTKPTFVRFLYSTWNAQVDAIKFQEIRNAIRDGDFSDDLWAEWEAEYVQVVNTRIVPQWKASAKLSSGIISDGIVTTFATTKIPFAPVLARADRWIQTRGVELAVRLTEDQRVSMRAIIQRFTIDDPLNPRELGRFLRAVTPLTPKQASAVANFRAELVKQGLARDVIENRVQNYAGYLRRLRAERIARTEVAFAYNRAGLDTVQEAIDRGDITERVVKEYLTALDDRVSAWCKGLHGTIVGMDETWPGPTKRVPNTLTPPTHPNCVPGWQPVSAVGVRAVSRRWFEGDLVIVHTASGIEFAVTANHPVLSGGRWVPARKLKEGDDLIKRSRPESKAGGHHNRDYVEARIEELAESFGRSRGVSAVEVPVTAPDFHGDGMDEQIAVVWTDRDLAGCSNPEHFQQSPNASLMGRFLRWIGLSAFGGLAQFGPAALATSDGCVSLSDLGGPLSLGHGGPFHPLPVRMPADLDPPRPQDAEYWRAADAELARQIIRGATGEVLIDKVVRVDVREWAGHVYNLETASNTFDASGIVTHNCRCSIVYHVLRDTRDVRP